MPQLLRAVAGAIRQAVLEAHHAHHVAVVRSGSEQIELMLEQVRDVLDDACAAPLSFVEAQQRRRREDEEGLR